MPELGGLRFRLTALSDNGPMIGVRLGRGKSANRLRIMLCHGLLALAIFLTSVMAPASASTVTALPLATALLGTAKDEMRGDPAAALVKAQKAEKLLLATPADERRVLGLAESRWLQGEAHLRLNDVDQAEPLIEMALAAIIGERKSTKLHADILVSRGQLDTLRAKVGSALADFQTAHNIFRELGETRSQAIALQQIASLYREADDFETAMKYDSQSAEIYKGDAGLEVSNFNNRGNYLVQNGRYAEAIAEYRRGLAIVRKLKSVAQQTFFLRNIARTQLKANQLDEADKTIALGLRLTSKGEGKARLDQMLAIAAQAALQRGQLGKAAGLVSHTFTGVNLAETSLSFRDAHETAYLTFSKMGRAALALVHLEALKRLDDQTAKLAASTNTALMAARFDDANKDAKIAMLKASEAMQSVAFEKARARQQRIVFIGIVLASSVGVAMLIFGLVTIRRSRNDVRAANVDLGASNVALEKALAAKTEFLATTSHEIRTPLNGILGMTQVMLADQDLAPATRDRLSVVQGAGLTMRALVDDILDVAKMETGNLTLEAVPMDLRVTLREVSRLWEEQARARGIAFMVELDRCPAMIVGDAARVRQIVFNLLSNALKFTSEGSVTLRAEATEDGLLAIAVSDTGIGIPADKLEVIFESFRQVDAGTARKFGGTGLGLSICRNLARAMDGEVQVTSVAGKGSTFAVSLPLILAEVTADDGGEMPGPALLIVDRNPISRSMLRALLAPRAGEVAFAASADEAVRLISAQAPKQVLIDDATIRAEPDMDRALRLVAAVALVKGTQAALLWPSPDDAERARLESTGLALVIAKPIGGDALVELLYPLSGQLPGQYGSDQGSDAAVTQCLVSRSA